MRDEQDSIVAAFEREELLERVRWQLRLRWVANALVLLGVLLAAVIFPGVLPTVRLLVILALLVGTNLLVMFVLLPRLERYGSILEPQLLIKGQIVVDLVAYTMFLHWSGGSENPAAFYYVLQVIIAGVLLSGRWAFLSAGVSVFLYALVLVLEFSGLVPHVHLRGIVDPGLYQRPALLLLLWGVEASALFLAAYLTSYIVGKLRQRERQLSQSNLACELRSGELAAANQRLNDMAAARDTFLRYVTHELRAPVGAIQSYLRLLREGYIEKERVPEVAARAERRAEEVLALIADLLDLGQVERAQVQQEGREPFYASESLNDAVDMLRPSAAAKRLKLEVHIGDDMPIIFANPRHLTLLWNNLLSNAIKYTPPEGRVTVRLYSDGSDIHAEFADTGIGIAPEDRENIFREFYRSEAARRFDPHGTGIGLAIVQRVVDMYGGRIEVESQVNKGTRFHVSLPLASLRANSPTPSPVNAQKPPSLPRTLV